MCRTNLFPAFISLTLVLLGGLPVIAEDGTATSTNKAKLTKPLSVVEKLSTMKPDINIKSEEKPDTITVLFYTVEGEALDGKPAAICDIGTCRIALVGQDISKTRSLARSLNVRVAGDGVNKQMLKSTDGKVFFTSQFKGGKSRCEFHGFGFDVSRRTLSCGPIQEGGFRTFLAHPKHPAGLGVLFLVDSATGKFTTHKMPKKAKRVVLPASKKSENNK